MESPPVPVVHFRWRRRPCEQVEATAGPVFSCSTSITVRDGRAIGRWDSVAKKFRLAGRSEFAAERNTLWLRLDTRVFRTARLLRQLHSSGFQLFRRSLHVPHSQRKMILYAQLFMVRRRRNIQHVLEPVI